MTFRLIATDLDGTLLRRDGTLPERNVAALHAARDAGLDVVVVTGRPPRWVDAIADELKLDGVAICSNGALVYDLVERRVVAEHLLAVDVAERLVAAVRAAVPGIGFACERAAGIVVEPDFDSPHEVSPDIRRASGAELLDAPIAKLLATHPDYEYADLLAAVTVAAGSDVVVTQSGSDGLVEISAAGITKAFAVEALCAERGISAAEVIAFGDMPNDVALLRWAGHGVAVATGHPDAIAAADEIAGSNDDSGVAAVLERILGNPNGSSNSA